MWADLCHPYCLRLGPTKVGIVFTSFVSSVHPFFLRVLLPCIAFMGSLPRVISRNGILTFTIIHLYLLAAQCVWHSATLDYSPFQTHQRLQRQHQQHHQL
ncbi:TPA: hypothetical protein ACH3X1_009016 [Trebouxia sp. C0004]